LGQTWEVLIPFSNINTTPESGIFFMTGFLRFFQRFPQINICGDSARIPFLEHAPASHASPSRRRVGCDSTLPRDVSVIRPRLFILTFCYPVTRESGGIQRDLTVIHTFIIRRPHVRWHAETNVVICTLSIDVNSFRSRIFSSHLLLSSDPRVRWYAETPYGYPHLRHSETPSPMTRRDQCGHLHPSGRCQRLPAETM